MLHVAPRPLACRIASAFFVLLLSALPAFADDEMVTDRLSNKLWSVEGEAFVPDQTTMALDRLLADHAYEALENRMMNPPDQSAVTPTLNWARTRAKDGASMIVPLLYAEMLWTISADNPYLNDARDTSAMMVAYALLLANADGVKCADPAAPPQHIDVLLSRYHAELQYLADLPDDAKDAILQKAVALEAKNARQRENDAYLCGFGQQEAVGKTAEPAYDLHDQPQFLPAEIWGQKQVEARAHFKALLTSLTDQLKNAPAAQPEPANPESEK